MRQPEWVQRPDGRGTRLEREATRVEEWSPTVTQMRDVVQAGRVCGLDFSEMLDLMPEGHNYLVGQAEVERASEIALEAVTTGRVIDFGFLPNAVIRFGGERGGPLWNRSALAMPFTDPWIIYHRWEGQTGMYLVNPSSDGRSFQIVEFQPAKIDGENMLLIGDRGEFHKTPDGSDLPDKRYNAWMMPSAARFVSDGIARNRINNDASSPEGAAAGNVGDPVMIALLILNTRNIDRETVSAPPKLQAARRKSGKPPIPNYDRVNSAPYVTAINISGPRRGRSEDLGGTHRSPVPHIRLGHPRTYQTGRSIFIRDTLVGVPDEQRAAFKSQRTHYEVKP